MIRFPITDTHVHLWDVTRLRYPWLDGVPYLNRSFLLHDYNAACGPVMPSTPVETAQGIPDAIASSSAFGWPSV